VQVDSVERDKREKGEREDRNEEWEKRREKRREGTQRSSGEDKVFNTVTVAVHRISISTRTGGIEIEWQRA
jgi:hypothetical protein